jgi:hypothetical protein
MYIFSSIANPLISTIERHSILHTFSQPRIPLKKAKTCYYNYEIPTIGLENIQPNP